MNRLEESKQFDLSMKDSKLDERERERDIKIVKESIVEDHGY